MTSFWVVITVLGLVATVFNVIMAALRRSVPRVAVVRGLAALVSLGLSLGIVLGKLVWQIHDPFNLTREAVFAGTGVVIFALLFLPSWVDQSTRAEESKVTMQERAMRPANATIRLEKRGGDEWVN